MVKLTISILRRIPDSRPLHWVSSTEPQLAPLLYVPSHLRVCPAASWPSASVQGQRMLTVDPGAVSGHSSPLSARGLHPSN